MRRPGWLNGGMRLVWARRRPSWIHCAISDSSAPAMRHSLATACPGLVLGPSWFGGAEREPGDLGQQVAAAAGDLPEFTRRGGALVLGAGAPPGMPRGDGVQPDREHPVSSGSGMIASHHARIEHEHDKSKLALPVSG